MPFRGGGSNSTFISGLSRVGDNPIIVRRMGEGSVNWLGRLIAKLSPQQGEPPQFASLASENEWHAAARRRGQFPVFSDFVGVFTVDAEGSAYFAEFADLRDQIVVEDVLSQHVVRWIAAERHAELAHLRPVRTALDMTCPSCKGSGTPSYAPAAATNLICECGGAGWIPRTPIAGARTGA